MLSVEEKNQYQRHLSLPSFGIAAQEKLKCASVLVIGAGGLGCPALQYLAAAGVGKIGIVDEDIVESSNLQRQVLFSQDNVGKPKAEIAAIKLRSMNPHIEIHSYIVRFKAANAESLLKEYDIILDGTDNFLSRYLINDASVLFNKVLIYGAIYQFEGQVSVFNYKNGPTYRCLFPNPPSSNALPSCSEIGVLGVLPGIIGSFQALESIKVITGVGSPLSGRVLLYNALDQKTRLIVLKPQLDRCKITSLEEKKISNCSNKISEETDHMIIESEPNDFFKMLREDKCAIVLDVREGWEREMSKILPSVHIPLSEFNSANEVSLSSDSKEQNVLVYCKAGVRSRMACESLKAQGFKKLYNLSGGILQWEAEGFPLD